MICKNCGSSSLRKDWKYCPECGSETNSVDIFTDFGRILNNVTKQMMKRSEEFEHVSSGENVRGFSINIIGNPSGEPGVEVREFGSSPKKSAKRVSKKASGSTLAEPKTMIRNLGDRIVVEVKLPGVKEKDISVEELEESLEIKASAKWATYFKIVTVPAGYSLSESYFENGKLTLELLAG